MTKNELNSYLSVILTTALETEPDYFPESMAYLAFGSDMDKWSVVRGVLTSASLVTISNNTIKLTDKGRGIALKCQAVAQGAK